MGHDHEGQRVSRRAVLAGVSSVGLGALLAACADGSPVTTSTGESVTPEARTSADASDLSDLFGEANTCTLTESTTQGPYYFDADKIRSDIREDREGTRLRVAIKVQDSESCQSLPDAVVEIWHCDAGGLYSGAESLSTGGAGGQAGGGQPSGGQAGGGQPGGGGRAGGQPGGGSQDLEPVDDTRYLRGAQVTNAEGIVEFVTIWPGWYRGRTVHIHAMVHLDGDRALTTQTMFDEQLNDTVFAQPPYAQRAEGRDTFNDNDSSYRESMLMAAREDGDGYVAAIVFAADPDRDGG